MSKDGVITPSFLLPQKRTAAMQQPFKTKNQCQNAELHSQRELAAMNSPTSVRSCEIWK